MLRTGLLLICLFPSCASLAMADTHATGAWCTTRIKAPNQHVRSGPSQYPYRRWADYILKELDLRKGDVVVDIGAGDGWWSERMAKSVGEEGIIYASEVEEKKVSEMTEKYADMKQIKPYLSETSNTGLSENACDLAFFSQVYHHLDRNTEVDYLRHLRKVVKPLGRLVVIEKYSEIATHRKAHGTPLSHLIKQAEQAGWILVRSELLTAPIITWRFSFRRTFFHLSRRLNP